MRRKKILLVDDSEVALMTEQMILQGAGPYELLLARDGQEALEVAAAEHPDVILLDVVMPGLDGLQTLKELRRREATREIPVIMVTTRGELENVEAAFAGGCNDYVTKPVNGMELVQKLQSLIG